MPSIIELLRHRQSVFLSRAAQTAAYENWSDDFSRKEIKEWWNGSVWSDKETFSIADFQTLSKSDLKSFGFVMWNENLILFPLWIWHSIKDGEILESIFGEKEPKSKEIDLDTRAGCIAYGFRIGETK